MNQEKSITPLMKQYNEIKKQYPDALLLFQVGDFYELFYQDAQKAAEFLGITLTARGRNNGDPIPLCGVPIHALDHYLRKLIKGGFHVAICDQLHEAVPGKVVDRGVTRVFTPGTLTDISLLDEKNASYICSLHETEDCVGLLFAELLTAQLFATTISKNSEKTLEAELLRFVPDEILLFQTTDKKKLLGSSARLNLCLTYVEIESSSDGFKEWIARQFKPDQATLFLQNQTLQDALKLLFFYLKKNQSGALEQFKSVHFYNSNDYLSIDPATQVNLELIENGHGTRKNTLFSVMDEACTPMGSRTIKKWLVRPLIKKEHILYRQEAITFFFDNPELCEQLRLLLKEIGDFERIIGRIALGHAQLQDYLHLMRVLGTLPNIKMLLATFTNISFINYSFHNLYDFAVLRDLMSTSLNTNLTRDWIINEGFDIQLDHIRLIIEQSNNLIMELEKREQQLTNIASLKIRYNQVHGYYIEITRTNLHLVPPYYIRHQTLVGKERFVTNELKQLESEIVTARNQVEQLEQQIYQKIKMEVGQFNAALRKTVQALAQLDAILGFAYLASQRGYRKPSFNDSGILTIKQGKHPIVGHLLQNRYIANDVYLNEKQKTWIITGPNMGGKSTFLRQVALISIMAQTGSFVPAIEADLPILDSIFTRIGSGDVISEGKSTFFVEMEEAAYICSHSTNKSLVILDEVGRGTSTFDGLALAQAIIEYLHNQIKPFCLFATHYHELTRLSEQYTGIANYHAANKKTAHGMILLYIIKEGIAQGSFGLEVGKLAKLPSSVLIRAEELLYQFPSYEMKIPELLESTRRDIPDKLHQRLTAHENIMTMLQQLNYDELSPKRALDLLWQIKELVQR